MSLQHRVFQDLLEETHAACDRGMLPRLKPAGPISIDAVGCPDFFECLNECADASLAQAASARGQHGGRTMTDALSLVAGYRSATKNIGLALAAAGKETEHNKNVATHDSQENQDLPVCMPGIGWCQKA